MTPGKDSAEDPCGPRKLTMTGRSMRSHVVPVRIVKLVRFRIAWPTLKQALFVDFPLGATPLNYTPPLHYSYGLQVRRSIGSLDQPRTLSRTLTLDDEGAARWASVASKLILQLSLILVSCLNFTQSRCFHGLNL